MNWENFCHNSVSGDWGLGNWGDGGDEGDGGDGGDEGDEGDGAIRFG
ncbi:MAG: hypothetical protein V7K67_18970 [Nostoc sp.]